MDGTVIDRLSPMVHSSRSSVVDGGLDAVYGQGDMQVLHDGESMMAIDRVSNSSTGLENLQARIVAKYPVNRSS